MANQHARVKVSQAVEVISLAWPLGCDLFLEAQRHSDISIESRNWRRAD